MTISVIVVLVIASLASTQAPILREINGTVFLSDATTEAPAGTNFFVLDNTSGFFIEGTTGILPGLDGSYSASIKGEDGDEVIVRAWIIGNIAVSGTETVVFSEDMSGSDVILNKFVSQSPSADSNGPYASTEGVPLTFDGSGSSDPDGSIVSYAWDFGDGNTGTGANPVNTYAQNGTYTVTLTVIDNDSPPDTSSTTAVIEDIDPVANFTGTPASGIEPLTVNFADVSTSYDGIISRAWDFENDGIVDSTDQNPSHVYNEGTYTVNLTVCESDGDCDTEIKTDYISVTKESPEQLNLINNSGFEFGTASWWFYTNGGGIFSSVSPVFEGSKAAKLSISSSGTNVQLYQPGITLEPNTRYQLSFSAYSTTGHDMSVYIHKHGSPYTNYGLSYTADLGTSWQSFTTEFATTGFTGTVNDGRIRFWLAPFAAAGDTYYIDDVRLEKI